MSPEGSAKMCESKQIGTGVAVAVLRRIACAVAIAVISLGGATAVRADECQKFMKKIDPVAKAESKRLGTPYGKAEAKTLLDVCKSTMADPDSRKSSFGVSIQCTLKAKTTKAIEACMGFGPKKPSNKNEAQRSLDRLRKSMATEYMTVSEFPKGSVAATPAGKPCCKRDGARCVPAGGDWSNAIWETLEFAPVESLQFQYSYESDGKTATIKAVGDLECDGKTETYTLKLSPKPNGEGEIDATLVEPKTSKK